MKKVILIEDNSDYYKIIKSICDSLQVSMFPETRDTFDKLRSSFSVVLTPKGEYQEDLRIERIKSVQNILAEYIADTKSQDIFCICDYELFERKARHVNGINFYTRFLGEEKEVVFASATTSINEIGYIENFCAKADNRSFLRKDDPWDNFSLDESDQKTRSTEFEKDLIEKIKNFLAKE